MFENRSLPTLVPMKMSETESAAALREHERVSTKRHRFSDILTAGERTRDEGGRRTIESEPIEKVQWK